MKDLASSELDAANGAEEQRVDAEGSKAQELTLAPGELFFSRTDERGVILAGNDLFQKFSGYGWEKLIGAPHKIIRSKEMPRGLFHFMWERLKAELPVATYVRNRTQSGDFYWVFSIAVPCRGGYLSVRMSPSTEHFEKTKSIFSEMLANERDHSTPPKQSAEDFENLLKSAGYRNIEDFMATAARAEFESFCKATNRRLPPEFERLNEIHSAIDVIRETSQEVKHTCERVSELPTNLQIRSSRLGSSAAPIGIIASDCSERTQALAAQMGDVARTTEEAARLVNVAFLACTTTQLQTDMASQFAAQSSTNSAVSQAKESDELSERIAKSQTEMLAAVVELERQTGQFASIAKNIDRLVVGMNVTRIMVGIESNILGETAGGIRDIIDNLDAFQSEVPEPLGKIDTCIDRIKSRITAIRASITA